jgi:hypothetical protein
MGEFRFLLLIHSYRPHQNSNPAQPPRTSASEVRQQLDTTLDHSFVLASSNAIYTIVAEYTSAEFSLR